MSSESVTPPPIEEQAGGESTEQSSLSTGTGSYPAVVDQRLQVKFSFLKWMSSGVVRLLYRRWTRIAAHLFPENSKSEQIAQTLHIPLPDKLNMSWVDSHLAVGGRVRPEDIRALALSGVTHVVDTRSEYRDDVEALRRENIELLHLPTPDTYPLSVEQLRQGAEWVNKHIQEGGRVLIHCEHGVGRSVLLTCAVLVARGMSAREALELVKRKRWQASPNQRQFARLREFEQASASKPDVPS